MSDCDEFQGRWTIPRQPKQETAAGESPLKKNIPSKYS